MTAVPGSGQDAGTNGGRLVVEALLEHGVRDLFCVPGESFLPVLDAALDVPDRLRVVTCRHESGAAFMAAAQAMLLGRPAVCFVTRGPGAANASIAVHVARQASIPLVLCVGQVRRERLGREAFQEVDYASMFGALALHVEQVGVAEAIPDALARAFALARSGRRGPVVLAFPEDVLDEDVVAAPEPRRAIVERGADGAALEAIAAALAAAERPLVIAGGSLWSDDACRDLERFAERNALPVCTAFRRQDVFDNTSASYAGYLGLGTPDSLWKNAADADTVLVLGARLDEPTTRAYTLFAGERAGRVLHVYPEALAAGPDAAPALSLVAHPGETAAALAAVALPASAAREAWRARLREDHLAAGAVTAPVPGTLDPVSVMDALNARIPDDAIVTVDAGNFTVWPQRHRAYRRPGRLLAPVNGAMGFGLPAAIGAALTWPERTVVACVGDGGMGMSGMELATAAKYGARVRVLVFNNDAYGTIATHQARRYPGRAIGNDLDNPDFAALARAFGLHGARVEAGTDACAALDAALAAPTASVLELVMSES